MRLSAKLKKFITVLTLAAFTFAVSGCAPEATTPKKSGPSKPSQSGTQTPADGAEVPLPAPEKTADNSKSGDENADEKAADEKPAEDKE